MKTKTNPCNLKITDKEIINLASAIWCAVEDIRKTLASTNTNSYYNDKQHRLLHRLQQSAEVLGQGLRTPNEDAFTSYEKTRSLAHQFGIRY